MVSNVLSKTLANAENRPRNSENPDAQNCSFLHKLAELSDPEALIWPYFLREYGPLWVEPSSTSEVTKELTKPVHVSLDRIILLVSGWVTGKMTGHHLYLTEDKKWCPHAEP